MNEERKIIEIAEIIFRNKYNGQYSSWRANTLNPDGSVTLRDKWGNFLKTITPEELKEAFERSANITES